MYSADSTFGGNDETIPYDQRVDFTALFVNQNAQTGSDHSEETALPQDMHRLLFSVYKFLCDVDPIHRERFIQILHLM